MGICCIPSTHITHFHFETFSNSPIPPATTGKAATNISESFQDMPEIPGKYSGYGIKKLPAYKCDLNIDELTNLRNHFWKTKISSNNKYRVIRQAILFDDSKSEEFLTKNGFRLVEGCINQIKDEHEVLYCIPNYCINEPFFEKCLLPVDGDAAHNEKEIKITLSESDIRVTFNVKEGVTGKEIKEMYIKEKGYDCKVEAIRLFFGGNEIKNEELLYQHKIKVGYIIQVGRVV